MLFHRSNGVWALTRLAQIILGLAVFWGLFAVVDFWLGPRYLTHAAYVEASLCLLCAMVMEALRPAASSLGTKKIGWVQAHFITVQQISFVILVFLLLIFIAKGDGLSRAFLMSYFMALHGLLLITNRQFPTWLSSLLFNGARSEKVLAIRTVHTSKDIENWLSLKAHLGLDVVKFVTWNRAVSKEDMLKTLAEEVEVLGVQHLLLLDLPENKDWLGDLVRFANRRGSRLLIINNLHEQIGHSLAMFNYDGLQLITLRSEPLESPFNRMIKRVCDILVSVPVVILVLPVLMLLVCLAQRLQAPGPLFYCQLRAGMNNQRFVIYKFRTMYTPRCDETQQVTSSDDRIFPIGRWMRRMSFDEMPQFLNVLQGNMSVIGPRPHMVEHNAAFERLLDSYNVRSWVKPGITGLAQVRGLRGEVAEKADVERRLKSDVYYLENWTLGLDLLILLRTITCFLFPPRSAV